MSLPKDGGLKSKNKPAKPLEPKPILVAQQKKLPTTGKPVRK